MSLLKKSTNVLSTLDDLKFPAGKLVHETINKTVVSSINGDIVSKMGGVLDTCISDEDGVLMKKLKQLKDVPRGHGIGHGQSRNQINDKSKSEPVCHGQNHGGPGSGQDIFTVDIDMPNDNTIQEIEDVIQKTWASIDTSAAKHIEMYAENQKMNTNKGWKVVRMFISSTFTDFHAEREVIVKKVMPELKEWCEQYQIHLLECDLRWGVPKNTNTTDTIGICLDELRQCIKETNGQPFFLNMLGERYGWIPTMEYLSEDVIKEYDWIYPTSITHTEILHGALRTNSQNAMFMIRDERSLNGLPLEFTRLFKDSKYFSKRCLQHLKHELMQRYPRQTFNYQSRVSGTETSTGLEKVTFSELDDFADRITNFFKDRITLFASKTTQVELSDIEREKMMQDVFIEKRGQLLIGREEEVSTMLNFVRSNWETKKCLFVIAESGTGKSSLVANHVLELQKEGIPCLYNFASSAPGSTNSLTVLQRFCHELSKLLETEPPSEKQSHDYEYLKIYFAEKLSEISKTTTDFTVVLDAINQFCDKKGRLCNWLPTPDDSINYRYIISCTPNFKEFDALIEKFTAVSKKIMLGGFEDIKCRKELARTLFARVNKKLDPDQLDMLTSCEAASSPLWIALACEELRVFGVFEQVTERIKNLPGTISELIGMILDRIIREDETHLVKKLLCYLRCSGSGLTETELRILLREESMDVLPMMTWATVKRTVKPFLLNTGVSGDEEMYTFFHIAVAEVISSNLLAESEVRKSYHSDLASYFLKQAKAQCVRDCVSISTHLKEAERYAELVEYFRKDQRSMRIPDVQKSFILSKLRCKTRLMPGKGPFQAPVHICSLCCMKTKVITPKPLQTKDLCIVCGGYAPWKKDNLQALLCNKHKVFGAPKTDKCYLCKKIIFLEQKSPVPLYSKCYLCSICNGGGCSCVHLL